MLRIAPLLIAAASACALDLTRDETYAIDLRLLPQLTTGVDDVDLTSGGTTDAIDVDDRVSGGVEAQVVFTYFLSRNWGWSAAIAGFWREHAFEDGGDSYYHAAGGGLRVAPVLRLDELEVSLPFGVDIGRGRYTESTISVAGSELENGPYLALSLALENTWTFANHCQAGFGAGAAWFQGEGSASLAGASVDLESHGLGAFGFLMLGYRF